MFSVQFLVTDPSVSFDSAKVSNFYSAAKSFLLMNVNGFLTICLNLTSIVFNQTIEI